MPQFYVSTAKGLSDVLCEELVELGFTHPKKTAAGAFIEGSWEDIYRLNLESRIASRILKPVLDFTAYNGEELYNNVIKGHDFTKYILPSQTFMIDATVKECAIHDQRFVAMKLKDAIADQFRQKCNGVRPDVNTDYPDMRVYIKGHKNHYSIAIDTSGEGLFKREYRDDTGLAPMKENLAAALVRMTGWDKTIPIVDLTCGSGTILIEAAMMAMNIAPGSFRRHFGFQTLQGYDDKKWKKVIDETMKKELSELPFKFYGFDIDRQVIRKAKANAANAGVDHVIEFKAESVATVNPPCEKGIVILNPPYGTRVGDEDNLRDVYRDLGYTLKTKFSGWDCYVLSGNKDLIVDLKLKASRKFFVYNGNLECRFLKYTIK